MRGDGSHPWEAGPAMVRQLMPLPPIESNPLIAVSVTLLYDPSPMESGELTRRREELKKSIQSRYHATEERVEEVLGAYEAAELMRRAVDGSN
jgi:hypothetical protein